MVNATSPDKPREQRYIGVEGGNSRVTERNNPVVPWRCFSTLRCLRAQPILGISSEYGSLKGMDIALYHTSRGNMFCGCDSCGRSDLNFIKEKYKNIAEPCDPPNTYPLARRVPGA